MVHNQQEKTERSEFNSQVRNWVEKCVCRTFWGDFDEKKENVEWEENLSARRAPQSLKFSVNRHSQTEQKSYFGGSAKLFPQLKPHSLQFKPPSKSPRTPTRRTLTGTEIYGGRGNWVGTG